MWIILVLSIVLAAAGASVSRKSKITDDIPILHEPRGAILNHRITGRSSAAFTSANNGLGIPHAPGDSSYGYLALSLASLGPRSLGGQLSHLKQPVKPIYHATPLQPYASLLDTKDSYQAKSYVKPIVENPQEAPYNQYSIASSSGRLTEAILHKPAVSTHVSTVYNSHGASPALAHSINQGHDDLHYAAKYQFGYQVRDPKGGNFFGHSEARDGHSTKGQYHVFLPDGRLQHVQYWADPSGYHAEISYNRPATTHT